MVRKLGMTGMDSKTEADLRAAFAQAQPLLGERWELASETEADPVVVDMDSMYGPMSWIRLHAAGKQVIGLTTSPRTQADHLLARPFDTKALAALLAEIGGKAPVAAAATDAPQPVAATPPSAATSAPAPADLLPEEQPVAVDEEAVAPPEPAAAIEPASAAPVVPIEPAPAAPVIPSEPAQAAPVTATEPTPVASIAEPEPAAAAPVAEPEPQPQPPPRDPVLADWLEPGSLPGRWRHARDGVGIVFDNDARLYHGPGALKPLAALFDGIVRREDLVPLDQGAWPAAVAGLGEAQPLVRLQWYAALLAGKGALLPGHDPDGKYRLTRWPQTEREFPKHFRIATAMMKGPATLAEVSAASGIALGEVADFVNANLASGHAEFVPPPPPEPAEPPKPSGLFGRLRGR